MKELACPGLELQGSLHVGMNALIERVQEYDVNAWGDDFLTFRKDWD